ncbi:MAG: hypothetical protein SFZ24_05110 [Planctomycetota bacterium]|nr:hypothetical protein [Planctomycetota bacterium]
MSCVTLDGWEPGGPPPNVWKLLRRAVTRGVPSAGDGRIAVDDSKKLKKQGLEPARAIEHLERGVLSFAWALAPDQALPEDDGSLLCRLGCTSLPAWPWYAAGRPVPVSTTGEHIRLLGQQLATCCGRAGVSVQGLSVSLLCERSWNEELARTRNKADVSFEVVAGFVRRAWDRWSAEPGLVDGGARLVIDRQGGRSYYAERLSRVLPGVEVSVSVESEHASRYVLSAPGGRVMTVTFQTEADAVHFPVALASMTAKYARELMMMRFNTYWSGRFAELKPTAGYGTDAGRWLRDVRAAGAGAEADGLVRRA